MSDEHDITSVRGDMGWCAECDEWHDLDDLKQDRLDSNDSNAD